MINKSALKTAVVAAAALVGTVFGSSKAQASQTGAPVLPVRAPVPGVGRAPAVALPVAHRTLVPGTPAVRRTVVPAHRPAVVQAAGRSPASLTALYLRSRSSRRPGGGAPTRNW